MSSEGEDLQNNLHRAILVLLILLLGIQKRKDEKEFNINKPGDCLGSYCVLIYV